MPSLHSLYLRTFLFFILFIVLAKIDSIDFYRVYFFD
nr:MAG TPA: hypothetical protein [Caudoviricetes sp.]